MKTPEKPPWAVCWSIAGSDSGAGAGLQADLRAFDALGVHGCTAVAALTAQNSVAVPRIDAVATDVLGAQLAALADDLPPAAIKTGLLGSVANLQCVAQAVDRLRQARPGMALVVDPVLRASTGAALADPALLQAYREHLLPRTTLLTPNRAEAAALLGWPPLVTCADVEAAAETLQALGCQAVVITGGDARDGLDSGHSLDFALTPQTSGWLSLPRIATRHHHGTGCVFASSAAAAMARGFVPMEAVVLAKMATTEALRHGRPAGAGAGPVRPQAGFALNPDNLPRLGLPGQGPDSLLAPPPAFAPLRHPAIGLYTVVDSAAWVDRVLAAGVRTVQLRIKDPAHPHLHAEIQQAVAATAAAGAQLFINDHWHPTVALAAGQPHVAVHLGQDDLAAAGPEGLAAIARAGLGLGVSTHAFWEVARAWALRPSTIACGPIHPTQSKAMPWLPQGTANLAYWAALLPLPVVGIAGMTPARAREALGVGAAGAAVITAVTEAADPEAAIAALQQAVAAGQADWGGAPKPAPPGLPQSTLRLP